MSDYVPPGRPADLAQDETWCRCGAIWRRTTRICHCANCHRTYSGISGFAGHRFAGECRPTGAEIAADARGRYKGHTNLPGGSSSTGELEEGT